MIIRNRTTTLGYAARSAVAADRLLMVARIVGFALLTALAARVQVPMFPVPMTLQTAAVLLSGILLGPVAGAASQALYLSMGLSGLPVFAGAVSGFAYSWRATLLICGAESNCAISRTWTTPWRLFFSPRRGMNPTVRFSTWGGRIPSI